MSPIKITQLALSLTLACHLGSTAHAQSTFAFDGPYVGIFGGSNQTSVKEGTLFWSNILDNGFASDSTNSNQKGTIGGISYGYNHRDSGTSTFVYGIDLSASFPNKPAMGMAINESDIWKPVQSTTKILSLMTLQPKLGVMLGQQTMVYGMGGLAWAKIRRTLTQLTPSIPDSGASAALFPDNTSAVTTENHWGYVLGFGVERMITQNTSLKLEFSHVDLGSQEFTHRNTTPVPGNPSNTIQQKLKITNSATVLGLNYRF